MPVPIQRLPLNLSPVLVQFPLPSLRCKIGGMGILPDNWIDVLAIVWLEWMITRPAYWQVYGQLADRDR